MTPQHNNTTGQQQTLKPSFFRRSLHRLLLLLTSDSPSPLSHFIPPSPPCFVLFRGPQNDGTFCARGSAPPPQEELEWLGKRLRTENDDAFDIMLDGAARAATNTDDEPSVILPQAPLR